METYFSFDLSKACVFVKLTEFKFIMCRVNIKVINTRKQLKLTARFV